MEMTIFVLKMVILSQSPALWVLAAHYSASVGEPRSFKSGETLASQPAGRKGSHGGGREDRTGDTWWRKPRTTSFVFILVVEPGRSKAREVNQFSGPLPRDQTV